MKRLHLLLYMALMCMGLQAQEEGLGEQLLVFRNTGVVDLLFTNEVDSIVTYDTEQVFYVKDTVIVVPFAELDSVAVGNRNVVEMNVDVRELSAETDLPWIIRYDEQSIFYRMDTPKDILPVVGKKLFYGLQDRKKENAVFPYGLTVRVTAVTQIENEIRVDVEYVEIDEIFDRLFYAGLITNNTESASRRATQTEREDFWRKFQEEIVYTISNNSSVKLEIDLALNGRVIYDVIRGRRRNFRGIIDLDHGLGFDLNLNMDTTMNHERYTPDVPLFTLYKLVDFDAAIGAYLDGSVELCLKGGIKRTYHNRLIWTNIGGENNFETYRIPLAEPEEDKLSAEVTFNGKVSFGTIFRLDVSFAGKRLGTRCKLKIGPELKGEFGVGLLSQLRNYNPELYRKVNIELSGRLKLEPYWITREYILRGNVVEVKWPYDFTTNFSYSRWNPFPNYCVTNAVFPLTPRVENTHNSPVEVATAVEEPPIVNLETGFEIVNPQGEVVDSAFVGTILAEPEDTTVAQTFEAEIPLPQTIQREDLEDYTVHPIFHYAGYTISAAPVGIKKDVLLQPYTSTQSNGAMTFISSGPFLDSAVADTTLYFLGTWMPVPLKHNVYQEALPNNPKVQGKYIDKAHANLLIGTWTGIIDNEELTIVFNEDGTGTYGERTFAYEVNKPQSGSLLLTFEGDDTLVFLVLSITETELKLKNRREMQQQVIELKRVVEG